MSPSKCDGDIGSGTGCSVPPAPVALQIRLKPPIRVIMSTHRERRCYYEVLEVERTASGEDQEILP